MTEMYMCLMLYIIVYVHLVCMACIHLAFLNVCNYTLYSTLGKVHDTS